MSGSSFWSRLRQARLFQVIVVYLGVSWALLQGVDVLRDTLSLPDWVGPTALILLVVGMIIIIATAWVQSHPMTTQRAQSEQLPGSWEVALGDVGRSVARGELPHLTWGRAVLGGIFAFSILFGVAGMYVVIKDRGRSFAPTEAVAAAAPAIAVMPFSVRGPDLEVWREGMVDLLSTNLDGVPGLRTINSRTILARWRERVPGETTPDLPMLLAVARDAGGAYALVGNAVAMGAGVRLSAEIYELASRTELGRASVEGPADSVLSLVDQLSVGVTRALLSRGGGELASSQHVASLTTTSLPALRAYLEGEALYRRADFSRAIAAYERAVEADSTFALALHRLSESYGWAEGVGSPKAREYLDGAMRYVDRLPARDAVLVRARWSFLRGTPEDFDALRAAVQKYPDDPEAWYRLGDSYWHIGPQALVTRSEAARALARAVSLDPSFTPYYIHLIEFALADGDSARARQLMEKYRELGAGDDRYARSHRVVFDLSFGNAATQQAAHAAIDTMDERDLISVRIRAVAPAAFEGREAIDRALRRRSDANSGAAYTLVFTLATRGKTREVLELLRTDPLISPSERPQVLADLTLLGLFEPTAALDRELRPMPIDSVGFYRNLVAAEYAARRGRWADYDRALVLLRQWQEQARTSGDTAQMRVRRDVVRALEGYGAWQRGRAAEALRLLQAVHGDLVGYGIALGVNTRVRWWLGELLAEMDRPGDAIRYFESFEGEPVALLRLGALYQQLGRQDRAREAYAEALVAWKDADADFPLARQAREALARLGADRP